ncbi:MAG TPA: cytochrome c biogenesis protein CcdA, partial [Jiangellaceae bacterium]
MTGVLAEWVQDGLGSWWAPGLAFAAGVISFASPCVFPLVPGYLSFVAGGEVRDERQPVVPILLFIAGFAAVFSALGAFTGAMTRLLRSTAGVRISGAIIIAFGVLMLLYALRLGSPGLFLERRPLLERARPGRAWAFPLGVAF